MISRLVSFAIFPAQLIGTRLGTFMSPAFSKKSLNDSKNYLKKNIKFEELMISSKGNIKLNAMLAKKPTENGAISKISKIFSNSFNASEVIARKKVWINFNGNGMCYEFLDPAQIKRIQNLGFDFFAFNFPGVLKSTGSPTQRRLIDASKSIIEYANGLGYDDLYICAHSLGGSIATNAVAELKQEKPVIYRKIKLIVDRTFASIKAVIKTFQLFRIIKWIFIKIVNFTNWNIRVKKVWEKIDIKKCLTYAPNDEVIPEPSSLFTKVKNTTNKCKIIKLNSYGHNDNLAISDLKKAIAIVS